MSGGWRDRLIALRNRILGINEPEVIREPVETSSLDQAGSVVEGQDVRGSGSIARSSKASINVSGLQTKAKAAETIVPQKRVSERKRATPNRAAGKPTPAANSASKERQPVDKRPSRPVAINLGIDFGTSFTKVCFRDVGTEESGVVCVGKDDALVSSDVAISRSGKLCLGDSAGSLKAPIRVPYLKMRLAGVPIGDDLPTIQGIELSSIAATKALASWFLASVIARSQAWIATSQADRLKGRVAVWSANVGVPVEHYDSPILKIFEEVLGVAWLWVRDDTIPQGLIEALSAYESCVPRLDTEVSDFHAVAEIAAAVQSFVMSREAQEGIYVYFDIGGGTVDGVAFNYLNWSGDRRINFYAGKVAPLGLAAMTASIDSEHGPLDAGIFERLMRDCDSDLSNERVIWVRRLVAEVIMTAKYKDGRNWQVDAIQNADYERKFVGQLSTSRMKPLIVFLGGGGSKSAWYAEAISSTYKAHQHERAGIPPYRLLQVPFPKDFSLNGAEDHDFNRFAISYGLSVPFGEGPEIGLPSEFGIAQKPKVRELVGVVDYANSKDVYG